MKIKNSLINLAVRALAESMNVTVMKVLAKELIEGYNLNKQTGFPESIPIPNRDAARQIVNDVNALNLFHHFVTLLIRIQYDGLMGRRYQISYLKDLVFGLQEHGFIYDNVNKIFVEDPKVMISRNWGTLREGFEYTFAFLRLDIVGNTKLVKKYPGDIIQKTYNDMRKIVEQAIEKRNGRIWNWEGDGGLVAFYFSNKNFYATLSGMEIINELFLYNQLYCKLDSPLMIRLAIHHGPCDYTEDAEELMKHETIKKIIEIESKYSEANTVTISDMVYASLDDTLANEFQMVHSAGGNKYYNYKIILE